MDDKTLNQILGRYIAPAPRLGLSAQILEAATASKQAMDIETLRPNPQTFIRRIMPIAASILAICFVGYTAFAPSLNEKTDTKVWQEAALDLGFDEIYNWVENEG